MAIPAELARAIPAELAGVEPVIDRFQVEGFLELMQKQIQSAGKRWFFFKTSAGPQVREKLTLEDMLCFQRDPIPTSMLKLNVVLASQATYLFQTILKYMGINSSDRPLSLEERIELIGRLYKQCFKPSELQDELFVQISKQTRKNPEREYLIKAWELMYLCASCMAPSKDIGEYLLVTHGVNITTDPEIQAITFKTLNALKSSMKAGPRRTIPDPIEIDALLTERKLTTIVFFLDDKFEEITYDMSTTVTEAIEELAGIINLSTYSSFSLYQCHKAVTSSKSSDSGNEEEYFMLDDNEHIGDLLAYFKAVKDGSKGDSFHCKLVLKRSLFRESDEAVTDPMFLHLSYVQLQHDYILGNYPIERDAVSELASKLSALQILAEIGFVRRPESCDEWDSFLERFLPRQIAMTRARGEWESDILSCYHSLEHMTKEDARQQFLHILRTLPYGFSAFFNVRKVEDPIGLLPGQIILGINKRGVHFFSPIPKKHLHSVELDDMEFGSRDTALFFKMRVVDFSHLFQFETKQAGEICAALLTYVDDVLLCQYSKVQSSNDQEDVAFQELEDLKKSLSFYKDSLAQVTNDRDRHRSLCNAKDKELQVAEESIKSLTNDKLILTEEISSLQSKHEKERTALNSQVSELEQECTALNSQVSDLERKLDVFKQELVTAESTILVKDSELTILKKKLKELKEMKEDGQTAAIVTEMKDLYKEERPTN